MPFLPPNQQRQLKALKADRLDSTTGNYSCKMILAEWFSCHCLELVAATQCFDEITLLPVQARRHLHASTASCRRE